MPVLSPFHASVGFTYPMLENADDDGELVADATVDYTTNDTSIQLNAPGFVTAGGNTMETHSFTALANGSAQITAKGTAANGNEVDAVLDVTVNTVEAGAITVGAPVA